MKSLKVELKARFGDFEGTLNICYRRSSTTLTRRNRANGRRVFFLKSYIALGSSLPHHPRQLFLDLQQAKLPCFLSCAANPARARSVFGTEHSCLGDHEFPALKGRCVQKYLCSPY